VNSISTDNRWAVQFMAALLVALGCQVRKAIHTVGDFIERRFAEFAGLPYQNPIGRQQWEDLWEMEAEP
jgi:broad specificity phosphatase PhoE